MSYRRVLDQAWAAHTAPRDDDAPTVVSLFAGAGGSSLGYSMAGYRELAAVEWDLHAAECIRRNLPEVQVITGDIAEIDPVMIKLAPGQLDVLDGSPPCQGFSTANRWRRPNDPRNQLFREYVRLLRAWAPRAFVMENVPNMARGSRKVIYQTIHAELRAAGYKVAARPLTASHFGVPQARQRMIFIGVRDDLNVTPSHPPPTTAPVTVRQAFAEITTPGLVVRPRGKIAKLAPLIHPGNNGGDALTTHGKRDAYFNLARLDWNRPAPTITKHFSAGRNGLLHPSKARFLTSTELCRLQSFPDQYDWGDSTYTQIHARLGNSVPPLMMREVAKHVRTILQAA